jgi:hypothetical protein
MSPNTPHDELLERYAQAKAALPDGLPDTPSAALHQAILQAARKQASAAKSVTSPTNSVSATHLNSSQNRATNQIIHKEAANDNLWNVKAFASLAMMGLAGLLWYQFEHGTPQEQEAAKSAKPSTIAVAAAPAAPSMPALETTTASAADVSATPRAEMSASTTAQAPSAANSARKEARSSKPSEVKIASTKDAASTATPPTAPPSAPSSQPAHEEERARAPETPPKIAAVPAPAPSAAATAAALAIPPPTTFEKASNDAAHSSELSKAAPSPQRSKDMAGASRMATAPASATPRSAPMQTPTAAPAATPMMRSAPSMATEPPDTDTRRQFNSDQTSNALPAPIASAKPAAPSAKSILLPTEPLFAAIDQRNAAALRQALAQGASPNARTREGNPALTQAVIQRWAEGVRILLAAGADRSSKNSKGHTAADVALELGFENMSRLLEAPR